MATVGAPKARLDRAEIASASEQLSVVMEQMDILTKVLTELKAKLDVQDTSLLGALQAGEEDDEVVQTPAATSAQPGNAGGKQTETGDKEVTKPLGGHEI